MNSSRERSAARQVVLSQYIQHSIPSSDKLSGDPDRAILHNGAWNWHRLKKEDSPLVTNRLSAIQRKKMSLQHLDMIFPSLSCLDIFLLNSPRLLVLWHTMTGHTDDDNELHAPQQHRVIQQRQAMHTCRPCKSVCGPASCRHMDIQLSISISQ